MFLSRKLLICIILILVTFIIILISNLSTMKAENNSMTNDLVRYSNIIDIENHVKAAENKHDNLNTIINKKELALNQLRENYDKLHSKEKRLNTELIKLVGELKKIKSDVYSEKEIVEDYGFQKFVFEYDDSASYKEQIKREKQYQKDLIKNNTACCILFELNYNESKSLGKKVQKQSMKMLIRGFNNEVDQIIKKLSFRNVDSSQTKVTKIYNSLNELNKNYGIEISPEYLESKEKELRLVYGKIIRLREEKEREKEKKALLREEKAVKAEIEKEIKRQEKKRLEKEKEIQLKEDIMKQVVEKLGTNNLEAEKAKAEIENLKAELQDLLGQEKAISQAQLTSAGYVYIISNIGSLGEDIYKIGLTRRLEPELRIRELSSASVPFPYSCHGMIWSLDAVKLESDLHEYFDNKRVNKVNKRKEFFNVTFDEIKEVIYKLHPDVELIEDVEAEEYYESLAIEKQLMNDSIERAA